MCLVCLINLILFIMPILFDIIHLTHLTLSCSSYIPILFILPILSILLILFICQSNPVHPLPLHLVHSKVVLIDVFVICARSHVIYIRRTSSFATSAPASVMVKLEDFLSRISEDLTSLWPPYLVLKRMGENILVFLWSQRIHQFGRIYIIQSHHPFGLPVRSVVFCSFFLGATMATHAEMRWHWSWMKLMGGTCLMSPMQLVILML